MSADKEYNLNNLSYVILPSKITGEENFVPEYENVYSFWENSWKKTFAESGSPQSHWQDHFLRQDAVVALKNNDTVLGCILSTVYSLNSISALKSEYFKYITPETVEQLKSQQIKRAMTMEYLCVDPQYKQNKQKLGIGRLLVALTTNVARSLGADCAFGMPILGTKVDKMIANVGGYVVQPDIKKYGYTLQLMVTPAQVNFKSEDTEVEQYRKKLWNSRQDYSLKTIEQTNSKKFAA